jgi:tetratricopeptide (TPR) repeat protein
VGVLLSALLLALAAFSAIFWWYLLPGPAAKGRASCSAGRSLEAGEAPKVEPLASQQQEEQALRELFASFAAAVVAGDERKIGSMLSVHRLTEEVARGAARPLSPSLRRAIRREIPSTVTRGFGLLFRLAGARGTKSVRARFLAQRSEAVAVVRWRATQGAGTYRFWLRKEGGGWRIYDFEDVAMGCRVSTLLLTGMEALGTNDRAVERAMERLHAAVQAAADGNLEVAEELVRKTAPAELPKALDAVRWLVVGVAQTARERYCEALESFDKAESLRPDVPVLDLLRARIHNELGRHQEALRFARAYEKAVAPDADAWEQIGKAEAGLGQWRKACDAYRSALRDAPDAVDCLIGLGKALPAGRKGELGEAFARLSRPRAQLVRIAEALLEADDAEALEALTAAFARIDPYHPDVAYYTAQVHLLREQYAEAADAVRNVLPRVTSESERPYFLDLYLNAESEASDCMTAYRGCPDPRYAFHDLARRLYDAGDARGLRRLIDAHAAKQPGDPRLHYWRAAAWRLEKKHHLADQAYALGMADRGPGDEVYEEFRYARVACRLEAGRGLSAYGEIAPGRETFAQLAEWFGRKGRNDDLAELIDLHVRTDPADPNLPLRRGEVEWLEGRYDEAVDVLTNNRERILQSKDNVDTFEYLLIRSLLRTSRHAEALKEARSSTARDGNPYYDVIAHVAAGQVQPAVDAMARFVRNGGDWEAFYDDEDVGPALRRPEFSPLRERFPPPARTPPSRAAPPAQSAPPGDRIDL